MASKAERTVINAAGLVQGVVLVTFPAASTIFTEKSEYGLSSSQYGIAAFGVGPLQGAGVSLSAIFGFTACVAAGMGVLSFFVARGRPAPGMAAARHNARAAGPGSRRAGPRRAG